MKKKKECVDEKKERVCVDADEKKRERVCG